MRILVTGATGYLGSRLAEHLLACGHTIIALKRRTSNLKRLKDLSGITFYDVEDGVEGEPLRKERVDLVVHTATCYGLDGEHPSTVVKANTLFPLELLEAAVEGHVPTFINTDTVLPQTANPYSASKSHFKEWGEHFSRQGAIRFINIRLQHFYGPGDSPSKFVTHVIRSCVANVSVLPLTRGTQSRDFIYIDDVLSAYGTVLAATPTLTESYEEYDVGTGVKTSIRELVTLVKSLTGAETEFLFGAVPLRAHDENDYVANIGRLRKLGWRWTTSVAEGLRKTIESEQ